MRQRRNSLQVSTFPFLAVLLCTMGSLILLLLVVDRRARMVALAKARNALFQSAQEDARAAAARRTEWKRRRQLLHQQLVIQDGELRAHLQAARSQEARRAGAFRAEEMGVQELRKQLEAQQFQLMRCEEDLSARRNEIVRTSNAAEASRTELAQLTADLNRMERTLADLKLLRQRQQQTYSLVPYHGKRGDQRKPIYVECTASSVVFHPDHGTLIPGLSLTSANLKDEVERRLAARREAATVVGTRPGARGYVLLLIRPDGITSFYRTTAILQQLNIDFGYEFIEGDWALDFPEDGTTPSNQPWTVAESGTATSQDKGPTRKVTGIQPNRCEGSIPGSTGTSRVNSEFVAQSVGAGPISGTPQNGQAGGNSTPATPSVAALISSRGPQAASDGVERNRGAEPGQQLDQTPGALGTRPPSGGPGLPTETHSIRQSSRGPGAFESAGIAAPWLGGRTGVPPVGLSLPRVISSAAPAPSSVPLSPGNEQAFSAESGTRMQGYPGTQAPSVGNAAHQDRAQGSDQPVNTQSSNAGNPGLGNSAGILPALVPGQAGPGPASLAGQAGKPTAHGPDNQPGGSQEHTDTTTDPRRAMPRDPLTELGPHDSQRRPPPSVGLRPTILNGNRDWIIPIECSATTLLILTTRQQITTASLSQQDVRDNALLEAVRQIIARRQATVRPGETPYRPMIRFRVRSDALQTYYLAYPALEALAVPMTREDLEPEQEPGKNLSR